eukprot:2083894-Rhodomonas_salina.1
MPWRHSRPCSTGVICCRSSTVAHSVLFAGGRLTYWSIRSLPRRSMILGQIESGENREAGKERQREKKIGRKRLGEKQWICREEEGGKRWEE